jgi:iron complex outermembrane recepter protein
VHSRLQSLLLSLSAVSVGSLISHEAFAQPSPSDTPTDTPTDNSTTNPPAPATDAKPADQPASPESGTISGTIRSPDLDAPLSGATVTVEGTTISAVTDEAGHFTLNAPPGRVTLRADFTGFRSIQRQLTVSAGKSADVDFPLALDQLLTEVVVVVGSRTPRTNVETTAPVDVVTAEEISHVGKTQTGRILSTLAPSFVSTQQASSDGTDHVDPASLRGLGPDQVLVLVNGKRRHKSALLNVNGTFGRGTVGTDLNAIATGSIKRIEILRDGAASQYGSDAIAGVINIVTKDYTDLLDITTETGITGSGDGGQIKTSANYGFKIGKKGFLNVTGEFTKKDATSRSGDYTGNVYTSATGANPYSMTADPDQKIDDMILAQRGLKRSDFRMKIGEPSGTDAKGAYNMEVPINDNATLYSTGDIGHRNGSSAGFYRLPQTPAQNVPEFYPNGFLPEIHSNINDLGITVGIRQKGDWTVDASITHGQNSFQFNIENSVNASYGTASPTTFDSGTVASQQTLGDIDLLRKIETSAVKSLAFVLGSEIRTENYKIIAGDLASYDDGNAKYFPGTTSPRVPGAEVFPGYQPSNAVDRSRNNIGVYSGFESEITKGLNVDVGGRYENYSDFGNSFTGKAAARIPLGKVIAIRAAGSTGFRAPSLQQLWFSNVSTLFLPDPAQGNLLVANQVLTSNNASPVTKAFGIPQLKVEKSTNVSGGITLRPFDNLSLTADGYFIRIKDRIVLTSQFSGANAAVKQLLMAFPGINQAQFFANAIDTDTTGADVVADYAVDTGAGTLTFGAAANFTKTEVKDVHIPSTLTDAFANKGLPATQLRTFFFGRLAQNRIEDSVPHQKGNASIRYNFKQFSALARANYFGKVRYKSDLANDGSNTDESFGAKVLFDADLGYQFTKNLQFVVGADNLLNTFPDKQTLNANLSFGRFVYSRNVTQFGQNGGFYYAKLELTFF